MKAPPVSPGADVQTPFRQEDFVVPKFDPILFQRIVDGPLDGSRMSHPGAGRDQDGATTLPGPAACFRKECPAEIEGVGARPVPPAHRSAPASETCFATDATATAVIEA